MAAPASFDERRQQLMAAAQALRLPLMQAQADQLLAYLDMLQRWNRVYNLTALRDPADMLSHHLIDCLAALPPLQRWWAAAPPVNHRVLDVGSGGGLPGVVLAAVGGVSVLGLAVLGWLAARAGGAPVGRSMARVMLWGVIAMGVTAGVGHLVGQAL